MQKKISLFLIFFHFFFIRAESKKNYTSKRMEFVVVTHHEKADSCQTGLKDMTILSIPDAFLVYTGCENKDKFAQSIVHISCAFDYIPTLTEHKYCKVNGTLVFRHSTSFRTAIMSLVSDKILLESGQMYCINKITNIAWQEDDGLCDFLGILEAKIRLRIVKHTSVTRNDLNYYAVAISDIDINDGVKNNLKFLRCEFGVNAVFREGDGTKTRRSILFPNTLLNVDEIPHDDLYSIGLLKPYLTHVFASQNQKEVFGIENAGNEERRLLEEFMSQYHTAHEMARIKSEVIPRVQAMQHGDIIKSVIEFATPNGLSLFEVTFMNIGRSCMAITFARKPQHDESIAAIVTSLQLQHRPRGRQRPIRSRSE